MLPTLTPDDIRCAWIAGRLSYRLRNIQRQIKAAWAKAAVSSLKFYAECTRRLGKSSFGLTWLTEDCIQHPGGVSAFFAPVKEGLRDYILPIIAETFAECPDDLKPVLDSSLTLTFPNGSKIIFRGSNNQQHRTKRGNAFRRVYVDEARDVDDLDNLIESVIIPSLFSTEGRVMIGSTPADTEDHPLYAIKQAAEREGCYFHANIYDAHKRDPEAFPIDRIEQWKRETTDTVAWQREYMALWVKDPSKTVVPEWSDTYVKAVEHDEFFPHYHKYVSLDSGVRDKTAVIFGYYDFKRASLIVEAETILVGSEVLTKTIAEKVKAIESALGYQETHERKTDAFRRLQDHERVYRRVADNNNLILVQDLDTLHGLDFFPTHKDELSAMINELRLWVQAGRIIVSPNCPETRGCLANAIWDKNKKELARSKVYGHFDALMALVYLVRNVNTQKNPIPEWFGKSWATHAGAPKFQEPNTAAFVIKHALRANTQTDSARADFVRGH